ncbi:lipid A core-O-antigen ligase [Vibrio ponticus]|nr:lipid A core-O-antigen ligase [Vibrio ponticus]
MATIHLTGTQLEPKAAKLPLIRPFLVSIGAIYILAMHFFMPNPGGSGLAYHSMPLLGSRLVSVSRLVCIK